MNLAEIGPGLYPAIPALEYHQKRLGLASNTALELVEHSPATYYAWVQEAIERQTAALSFGRAFHCATVEPDEFGRLYVVQPDFGDCRFRGPKAERDAWRKENAGKEILTLEDAGAIAGMGAAVRRHPIAGPLVKGAVSEITCVWRDPETGLPCKARGDLWAPRLRTLTDLKSTEDARANPFRHSCEVYGYDRQEAFYRRGWAMVDEPAEYFTFIAAEKSWPHLVAVYTLSANSVDEADKKNGECMRTLANCLASDRWPGLVDPKTGRPKIQELDLRPWRLEK